MEKINRNFRIPDWVGKLLDIEAGKADGPGEVTGAAIYMFCHLPVQERIRAIAAYHEAELRHSYGGTNQENKDARK